MKSLKFFAVAFALLFALVACNSNDRLINKYEKAMEAGDYVKAQAILEKISEDKLSDEQKTRLLEITYEKQGQMVEDAVDKLQTATDDAVSSVESALDFADDDAWDEADED